MNAFSVFNVVVLRAFALRINAAKATIGANAVVEYARYLQSVVIGELSKTDLHKATMTTSKYLNFLEVTISCDLNDFSVVDILRVKPDIFTALIDSSMLAVVLILS